MGYSVAAALAPSALVSARANDALQMLKRSIPGTDEALAVVGLGNAKPFGAGDYDLTGQLLDILLQRGGGYVDTSGAGRFTVGELMRQKQAHQQLFLGTNLAGQNSQALRAEINAVAKAQGGGVLDLVLSREPDDLLARSDEFQKLKQDGLTRYVGVARSNEQFYPPIMELMRAGAVDFIQINYSMLEPGAADEILPLAQEQNVAVIVNRPFVNGRYFPRVSGHELPEWAAEFDCTSWAQFSLKYILAHPAVNCVITETANPRHAIDNLGAGIGRLPDEATRRRMRQLIDGFA
jgi:diketogulonate reductase-like aldo/keto reductase